MRTSVFKLIARSKCDYSGVTKTTLTKTNIDTNIIDPSRREKSGKIRRGMEGGREGGRDGWREGGRGGGMEGGRGGWMDRGTERGMGEREKGRKGIINFIKTFYLFLVNLVFSTYIKFNLIS